MSTNIVCLTYPEPALSQTSLSIRFGIIQQSGAYKCNAEQKNGRNALQEAAQRRKQQIQNQQCRKAGDEFFNWQLQQSRQSS